MIKILGTKRIVVLLALLGVNLLFAGVMYGYMAPEKIKEEKALRSVKGQVTTLQKDISRLQIEYSQLEEQKERFAEIEGLGFFGSQGRREVELLLPKVQEESGVVRAVANVQPGVIENSEFAEKANHKILSSNIFVTVGAMDDIGVYRYLYLLEQALPGHILVENIEMRRNREVNGALLKSVMAGVVPEMITADVRLTWRTMIPDDLGEGEE